MNCPRCGNRFLDRNQDKDWECWNCGKVVYVNVLDKPEKRQTAPRLPTSHAMVRTR